MAFSSIGNQEQFGKFLQIAFSDGIRNQISNDFRDWEYIKREKVADPKGREIRFLFQNDLGPSAVQYRNPNFSADFPDAQQASSTEHTAVTKELNATIQIQQNTIERYNMGKELSYADPFVVEMNSKMTAIKRQMSKDLYGDGTGVLGTLAANSATVESGNVRLQLDTTNAARGHVGFFEPAEILVLREADGTATAFDTNLATEPVYWKVVSRRRSDDTVVLQGLDSSFAAVTVASITTQPGAGEVLYKYGQPTGGSSALDLTSISDYGTATEVIPGLESLTADDGRTTHGITMSGTTGGTRHDASDVQIDVSHLESVMNDVKINVGAGQYAWKMAMMAPETYSTFIESRETDRRFNTVEDVKRGAPKFVYIHREDSIEFHGSEYCPKKRMYIMPEAKAGQGSVIEYHGTDFTPVKDLEGRSSFLKPSANGGFERRHISYLQGYGTLIAKHPAACAVIENFRID